MKNLSQILITAVAAAVVAFAVVNYAKPAAVDHATGTLYDQVIKRGTIRCAYTRYSVGLMKDPNTGKVSGIYHDVIEKIAANLSLKVAWTEEVGWANQIEGLQAGRYDMICSPVSLNSGRARAADFSIPLFYSPVQVWVKADNNSLHSVDQLNDPKIKIAVLDGEQTSVFARQFFPKAQTVSLLQTVQFSDLLLQVTTGKADVVFAEPLAVREFMESNPGSLKAITNTKPLVLVPNIFLLKRDEFEFKEMLDNALRELFNTGYMDQVISQYEKYPNSYVRETGMR